MRERFYSSPVVGKLHRAYRFTQAYLFLRRLHRVLEQGGFTRARKEILCSWKPGNRDLDPESPRVKDIEWAVEEACKWQLKKSECLHRSLTGYHLLRQVGGRPRFIMAVQNKPFASHAWVQLGETVIADRAMSTRRYRFQPILCLPDNPAGVRTLPGLTGAEKAAPAGGQ